MAPQKEIIFITYNEAYSGIYQSQIIDVAHYLEKHFSVKTKVICLAPLKSFFKFKKQFKSIDSKVLVFPSFPKLIWWKHSAIVIQLFRVFKKPAVAIGRNPFATNIALQLKTKNIFSTVCFDARGAFAAEFQEYLTKNETLQKLAQQLEENAILNSDFRIIVTEKLLEHYIKTYKYNLQNHVIIPTTLDNNFRKQLPSIETVNKIRKGLGIAEDAVVIAFSGGNADWQSFEMIDDFLCKHIAKNQKVVALLLTKTDICSWNTKKRFPNNIVQTFVKPTQVFELLSVCDYGLLLREQTLTNNVASPTKCAEYIACGLPVIISDFLGDYSQMIEKNNLGFVYKNSLIELQKISFQTKIKQQQFAENNFFKSSEINNKKYQNLITALIN